MTRSAMSPQASVAAEMDDPTRIRQTLQTLGAKFLVRGWLSSNNVVFAEHSAETAVVDTGYASHAKQTLQLLNQILRGADLHQIVNTHLHSDHCGGNAALQHRWPDAQTWIPQGYAPHLSPWDAQALGYLDCDQQCPPFRASHLLRPGQALRLGRREWQVHGTGGHDPDAVILFEPQTATLISGDALWQERLAIIFPELHGQPGFDDTARTIDLIERLAPRLVLPGHGPAFTGVSQAIQTSRTRLEAFAANPDKHQQHALRALLMYHMLEYQSQTRDALVQWMLATPLFQRALARMGQTDTAPSIASGIVQRLIDDRALQEHAGQIHIPRT